MWCVAQICCLCVDAELQAELQEAHQDPLLLRPLLLLLTPCPRLACIKVLLLLELWVLQINEWGQDCQSGSKPLPTAHSS